MNILFFLTPKSEVACIYENMSLRQGMEIMENHRFSCVPLLHRDGRYMGTITEGDFLWEIRDRYNLNMREAEKVPVTSIPRNRDYFPVHIGETIESVMKLALAQNFVPVVDDRAMFIGIITRRDILRYYSNESREKSPGEEAETGQA